MIISPPLLTPTPLVTNCILLSPQLSHSKKLDVTVRGEKTGEGVRL